MAKQQQQLTKKKKTLMYVDSFLGQYFVGVQIC